MDLTQLLRTQARRYKCTACAANMADCDIDVLAHQANRALVKVTCTACRDENLLQIIFQSDDGTDVETDTEFVAAKPKLFNEPRPAITDEISADEMLDIHRLLDGIQTGGFSALIGTPDN